MDTTCSTHNISNHTQKKTNLPALLPELRPELSDCRPRPSPPSVVYESYVMLDELTKAKWGVKRG